MNATRMLDLACPRCGQDLAGLDGDALFTCRSCAVALDPVGGTVHPIRQVAADTPGERLQLAVWRFRATLSWHQGDERHAAAARQVAERIEHVYVTGFALAREEHFGSPGLIRTRRQLSHPILPPAPGEERILVGIRRSAAAASAFVLPYLLSIVDGLQDITGFEAEANVTSTELLACPFLDSGSRALDLVTGLQYPTAVLDDIDGIRRAHRRSKPPIAARR